MKLKFSVNDIPSYLETNKLILNIGNNCIDISGHESHVERRLFYKFSNLCNMACDYCFQSKDVLHRSINDDIILGRLDIFEEYFKKYNYERVLFGGEPFLEINLPYLNWLIEETSHNYIAFTNGVFSEKLKKFIIKNINRFDGFAISIDGPEHIHNKRRVFKGGNGFKLIIENIRELINSGLRLTIQTNIDSNNYNSVEMLLEYLEREICISNKDVVFSLNPVLHCSESSDELELLECGINLMKKYNNITLNINSITLQKLEKMLFGKGISKNRCRIGNDIVADFSTGELYSCSQDVSTSIGTVNKDIYIDLYKKDFYKLVNNKQNDICLNCDLIYFCSYGCYIDRKFMDGEKCRKKTGEALELILNNFSVFFDLEE